MDAEEKGNREFEFLLFVFQKEELCFSGILRLSNQPRIRMRRIDLIDWTSPSGQPRLDYAKPLAHLQLLCIPGVQISLDAFSGRHPEI